MAPMTTPKPDSPTPVPAPKPVQKPRSEALEAELAMLEAILPPEAEGSAQPTREDPSKDRGDSR
jgi:hypothetical protein